jgi:hypothetical protein
MCWSPSSWVLFVPTRWPRLISSIPSEHRWDGETRWILSSEYRWDEKVRCDLWKFTPHFCSQYHSRFHVLSLIASRVDARQNLVIVSICLGSNFHIVTSSIRIWLKSRVVKDFVISWSVLGSVSIVSFNHAAIAYRANCDQYCVSRCSLCRPKLPVVSSYFLGA